VIQAALPLRDIYPDYIEAGNVYEFLAEAYLAKNDKAAAAAELQRYAKAGGRSPAALKKLATLLAEAGRKKDAAAALDRLTYIYPVDEELHRQLGDLWLETGNIAGAVREYRAVLARNPGDPAASHFNLARALHKANQPKEALDQLLLSLEAAPGFRPAQKMLLELSK
jgi:thioredoxin-like negative regulator of GroEL